MHTLLEQVRQEILSSFKPIAQSDPVLNATDEDSVVRKYNSVAPVGFRYAVENALSVLGEHQMGAYFMEYVSHCLMVVYKACRTFKPSGLTLGTYAELCLRSDKSFAARMDAQNGCLKIPESVGRQLRQLGEAVSATRQTQGLDPENPLHVRICVLEFYLEEHLKHRFDDYQQLLEASKPKSPQKRRLRAEETRLLKEVDELALINEVGSNPIDKWINHLAVLCSREKLKAHTEWTVDKVRDLMELQEMLSDTLRLDLRLFDKYDASERTIIETADAFDRLMEEFNDSRSRLGKLGTEEEVHELRDVVELITEMELFDAVFPTSGETFNFQELIHLHTQGNLTAESPLIKGIMTLDQAQTLVKAITFTGVWQQKAAVAYVQ